jgi:hypothetical protein
MCVNTPAEEAFIAEQLHSQDVFPMEDDALPGAKKG